MNLPLKHALLAAGALALVSPLPAQSTQIIRVEITSPTNESATAYSPSASPASATATVLPAGVLTTTITNPGSGYTTANVTVSGGGVTNASGTATVNPATGEVTGITITPTSGYTSAPTITISAPAAGTQATVSATVSAGTVTGIAITSPGAGYLTAPTVTISGGGATTPATATAVIANGAVTGITVASAGAGYTSAPTVTISAPPGLITVAARITGVAAGGSVNTTFFANGKRISNATLGSNPQTAWAPPQPGAYFITAETADSFGNTALSQAVRVFVTGAKVFSPIAHTAMPLGSSMVISGDGEVGSSAVNPFTGQTVFTPGFIRSLKFDIFDGSGAMVSSQTAASFPYSVQYTPPALGFYKITATATDNNDQTYVSTDLVDIQVVRAIGTPPISRIVNPVANGSVAAGAAVNIIADAGWSTTEANPGKISKVEFYLDGALLGTSSTFPFTTNWTPGVPGRYTLVAVAYDDKGNVVTSAPTLVNVTGGLPTVALTSPAGGVTVVQGAKLSVAVSAAGADGGITSLKLVEFLVDGSVYDFVPKTDPASGTTQPLTEPFAFTWRSNVSLGVHRLAARVTDKNNLTITSAEIPVTVIANQLPTVAISAPAAGTTYPQNATVTITASASDPDGSVESVEFFVNGISLGAAVTKPPFQVTWTPATAGPYTISAKVTDNAGATTTSGNVTVTVEAPQKNDVAGGGGSTGSTVYRGNYASSTETGGFAFAVNRNNRGTFIGFSTVPKGRVYFWTDVPINADGTFSVRDTTNTVVLSGQTSATGVSGTFGGKTFIGPVSIASATSTPLLLTGTVAGVPNSQVVAITGDGAVTFYVAAGTAREAGTDVIGATGNYSFAAPTGGQFIGNVANGASIVSGSVTGGVNGTFLLRLQPGRLANISTRAVSGVDDRTLVAGFVVTGTGTKPLLIRAVGPTLANFGVVGAVTDPTLTITNAAGAIVSSNNDWGNSSALTTLASQVGAFPLTANSRDAALQVSVAPGTYSALVGGGTGSTPALLEIYDADPASAVSSRLTNLSTRGVVTAAEPLIAGFVITGDERKRLLIRAVGPTLGSFGVPGALADPRLEIFSGTTSIANNNDWTEASVVTLVATEQQNVGAFSLNPGSKDAAIVVQLSPGSYTVQVTGVGGTGGTALVEIYDADPK